MTQVLTDGGNTYHYGLSRLGQEATTTEFFLGDALGSVRQMADASGAITLTKSYTPFGEVLSESGSGVSIYGYTGEVTDANGLVYLRARYYMPGSGRLSTRDSLFGIFYLPQTLNHWNYVEANPINKVDPSGNISQEESDEAYKIVNRLLNTYNVKIFADWAYFYVGQIDIIPGNGLPLVYNRCLNREGNWRNLRELELTEEAVNGMASIMGGPARFKSAMNVQINLSRVDSNTTYAGLAYFNNVILYNNAFEVTDLWSKYVVVHELAHVWDSQNWFSLSRGMMYEVGAYKEYCYPNTTGVEFCTYIYDANTSSEPAPYWYAETSSLEDWAVSLGNYVYPNPFTGILRTKRRNYIEGLLPSEPPQRRGYLDY